VAGKQEKTAPSLESIKAKLRAAGLRGTSPRIAVLRWLETSSRPVSHPELAEYLAEEGFDRATIYRNLIDLTETGLVSRSDLGDHVWRFELRHEGAGLKNEHAHFTCTDCGTVECLPEVNVRITGSKQAPRAVTRPKTLEIQLRGVCDSCD
jgi:Fur family transcriptional regulator, ferric uptake regulator